MQDETQTQEPNLFDQLLGEVTVGEKITDPREGEYFEAKVLSAELGSRSDGWAIKMRWGGMTDTSGREFELPDSIHIATPEDSPQRQSMFLRFLQDLGVISPKRSDYNNARTAPDETQARTFVAMVQAVADLGMPQHLVIVQDGAFMRVRLRRTKRN